MQKLCHRNHQLFLQLRGKEETDPKATFFLTASGAPAVVSKSMFKVFVDTTGLAKASANTLRKGATTKLREDAQMSAKESVIMDHSDKTADHYYDQSRTSDQVGWMGAGVHENHLQFFLQVKGKTWLSDIDSGSQLSLKAVNYEVSPETSSGWSKREEQEKRRAKERSMEFMRDADKYSNPANKVTARWRILPEWRIKLAEAMLADPNSEIGQRVCPPAKFPKDKKGQRSE